MCARSVTFTLLFAGFLGISSEREHKVHNIVLYPEMHSWCQLTPIQQIIASPGYESVTIDNNVCVGACYSYSIPKTQPAEPGELIGPYCDSCQPSEIKCYHVNLKQIDKNAELPVLQKRVQIITNCSCQSCDKVRTEDCEITDGHTLELPQSLFTIDKNSNKHSEEVPDILETKNTQRLPSSDGDVKKQKYKKWFESHQNEIERDYGTDLYRLFLKQNRDNNLKIDEDSSPPDLPVRFGSEDVRAHAALTGILQHPPESSSRRIDDDEDEDGDDLDEVVSSEKPSVHPNDVRILAEVKAKSGESKSSEAGSNVVHLMKGPHGSLVASPVETKLQIDSDALRPNSEGVVIDYGTPQTKLPNKALAEIFDD
ncbi:unnamed protein product [Phyllotreta striolata]|uniref:DAN domain-containing protein n=1 Tax=Phyllotreta striolata TaxID=444603 RepID=A0A9N9TVA7_PHYSR|nr:unnamed protein product [Phyllotreta striolata]